MAFWLIELIAADCRLPVAGCRLAAALLLLAAIAIDHDRWKATEGRPENIWAALFLLSVLVGCFAVGFVGRLPVVVWWSWFGVSAAVVI